MHRQERTEYTLNLEEENREKRIEFELKQLNYKQKIEILNLQLSILAIPSGLSYIALNPNFGVKK